MCKQRLRALPRTGHLSFQHHKHHQHCHLLSTICPSIHHSNRSIEAIDGSIARSKRPMGRSIDRIDRAIDRGLESLDRSIDTDRSINRFEAIDQSDRSIDDSKRSIDRLTIDSSRSIDRSHNASPSVAKKTFMRRRTKLWHGQRHFLGSDFTKVRYIQTILTQRFECSSQAHGEKNALAE